MPLTETTSQAQAMRACCATPAGAVHTCHLCGKRDNQPHTNATRAVHSDHMARFGWSGMCAAPAEQVTAAQARKELADLIAANTCPTCHAWNGTAEQCAECAAIPALQR